DHEPDAAVGAEVPAYVARLLERIGRAQAGGAEGAAAIGADSLHLPGRLIVPIGIGNSAVEDKRTILSWNRETVDADQPAQNAARPAAHQARRKGLGDGAFILPDQPAGLAGCSTRHRAERV